MPGALPPVMGWTAAHGSVLAKQAAVLFCILFFWQMPHFLAIATMYRRDYAAGGFKMLPVVDESLSITGRQIVLYAGGADPDHADADAAADDRRGVLRRGVPAGRGAT